MAVRILRILLLFFLLVAVVIEGYYIIVLRDQNRSTNEVLGEISGQLQSLKQERDELKAEISVLKEQSGEQEDDTAAAGKP